MKTPPASLLAGVFVTRRLGRDEADRLVDDLQVVLWGDRHRVADRLTVLVLEAGDDRIAVQEVEGLAPLHVDAGMAETRDDLPVLVERVGEDPDPPEGLVAELIEPGDAGVGHVGDLLIHRRRSRREGEANREIRLLAVVVPVDALLHGRINHLPLRLLQVEDEVGDRAALRRLDHLGAGGLADIALSAQVGLLRRLPAHDTHGLGDCLLAGE